MLERMQKFWIPYIAGEIVKWYNHAGKYFGILLKTNHTLTTLSSNCTPEYLCQKSKNISTQKPAHKCSYQLYL